MKTWINEDAQAQLFTAARTHTAWLDKPVDAALLQAVYDLAKWGPTSSNTCPMRVRFIVSAEAKDRLKPCLAAGNVDKTMSAPVTAIIAEDHAFYDQMPVLFPARDVRAGFLGKPDHIRDTAVYNTTLQAAYLIMAARAFGLDCGPMAGFDKAKVDQAFFVGTTLKTNLLVNIGYGDAGKLYSRNPRPSFEQACQIL
ncbi:MAG: malonic semialdehyde reductase [Burkholderiaceae bacterium]|jgi:3-hydroxypropanoate dehydrogenase